MYGADPDPYCYPNSDVLINKAGLRTAEELEKFETAMTFVRSEEALPNGRWSVSHYCSIHRHLFQDVYSWAGKFRTVRIAKDASTFCYPEHIHREMRDLFVRLRRNSHLRDRTPANFAEGAANFISELNAIHPFREGNGRTQLTFLAMLADQAQHPVDLDLIDKDATLRAMIGAFNGDEGPLAGLIGQWIAA